MAWIKTSQLLLKQKTCFWKVVKMDLVFLTKKIHIVIDILYKYNFLVFDPMKKKLHKFIPDIQYWCTVYIMSPVW